MKTLKIVPGAILCMAYAMPALAETFTFKVAEDVAWENDFSQAEELTVTNKVDFSFNGGAGTDGTSSAEGDLAFTGGLSGQFALGDGNAYANTDGDLFGESLFESGAFVASGAVAGDFAFGDISTVDVGGLVTAGGAGSAGTGVTYGTSYDLAQNGSESFGYKLKVTAQ
jgi:hypothetical protein